MIGQKIFRWKSLYAVPLLLLFTNVISLASVLIAGVGIFANGLVGNPVFKWLDTNTAKSRLTEVYADTDYEIERVTYSFKDGGYHAFIVSSSSPDSEFPMSLTSKGFFLDL